MIFEPIDEVLELIGVKAELTKVSLSDPNKTEFIPVIPGFDFNFLANGRASTSTFERQSYSFQTSIGVVEHFGIKFKDIFYINDTVNKYTFQVNTNPIVDITGWSRIFADLINKERDYSKPLISITTFTI